MVILEGYIDIPAEDMAAVVQELPNHIQLTRSEPGCQLFRIDADPEKPNRFQVYEEFIDQAAFKAHQQRGQQSRWGLITRNAVRHYHVRY